jgi:hypothetical protein
MKIEENDLQFSSSIKREKYLTSSHPSMTSLEYALKKNKKDYK